MSVFYIFEASFKFLTLFKSKASIYRFKRISIPRSERISASRSIFKNSSKSKAYILKVKAKDVNLHELFSIIIKRNLAMSEYFICSFWILNHNSDIYIVNKIMQYRFINKRNCIDKFIITTEKEMLTIVSYESTTVNV